MSNVGWIEAIVAIGTIAGLILFIAKKWYGKKARQRREIEKADTDSRSDMTRTFDKLGIIVVALLLQGCAVTLHPVTHEDILRLKEGQGIHYYDPQSGEEVRGAPSDGYFFSDDYVREVMEARVR